MRHDLHASSEAELYGMVQAPNLVEMFFEVNRMLQTGEHQSLGLNDASILQEGAISLCRYSWRLS